MAKNMETGILGFMAGILVVMRLRQILIST